jgi:uncharacterized protein
MRGRTREHARPGVAAYDARMDWAGNLQALLGGGLIGLAASLYLLVNGRVAGVSGVAAGFLARFDGDWFERAAFLGGLVAAPLLFRLAFGALPDVRPEGGLALFAIAGLFVGFGTRLGSGCTSGHGVCGLARFSRRSLAAVATFFAAAIVTVFVMEHTL